MSFVIVSASDVLYGPTALSTEDSILHEQLSGNVSSSLTLSRRRRHREKGQSKPDKNEKILRKYESKLAECKEKQNESKAQHLREKIDYLVQREKERIAVKEDEKINYDPSGKSIVFKVEDAPVRVLNNLAALGYSILPSAGGGGSSSSGHRASFVWTLFKPNYHPTPIYPHLHLSSTD